MTEASASSEIPTVGIVLISHSRAIAEGAADVAAQVSAGAVRIVGVGGTEDGRLGTSLDALVGAVYLADQDGTEVMVADAPFVEGAVAAAVTASGGATLSEVVAAAEGARDVRKL